MTVVFGAGPGVAQTATEMTAAACEAVQKQLNGTLIIPNREAYRRVDCISIPVKK